MITEAQRRALFALREALQLCEKSSIWVQAREGSPGCLLQQEVTIGVAFHYTGESFLSSENIDAILAEHPDV